MNVAGIDDAAGCEHHANLARKERMLVEECDPVPGLGAACAILAQNQFGRNAVLQQHRLEHLRRFVGRDGAETHARAAGNLNVHDRLVGTHAVAADFDDIRIDFVLCQEFPDGSQGLAGSGAQAAGACADENHRLRHRIAPQRSEHGRQFLRTFGPRVDKGFCFEILQQGVGYFAKIDPAFAGTIFDCSIRISGHSWTPFPYIPV